MIPRFTPERGREHRGKWGRGPLRPGYDPQEVRHVLEDMRENATKGRWSSSLGHEFRDTDPRFSRTTGLRFRDILTGDMPHG